MSKKRQLKATEWFSFSNMAENAEVAEIQLFGYIGEWEQINYQDLIFVVEQLPESVNKLIITINSKGGEVYEGNAISNALQLLKNKKRLTIETRVYMAASMAGVIALVGDRIIGIKNASTWHAHEVKGGAWGNSKSLRQTADHIDQLTNDIAQRYAKRTGIDVEVIKSEWMGEGVEKYFTSEEALEIGLFDEVIDLSEPMPANSLEDKDRHQFFNKILNVGSMPAETTDTDMDFNKLKNSLVAKGLGELVAKVEDETTLMAFISGLADKNTELTNSLEAVNTELTAVKETLEGSAKAQKEAKAIALVEKAIEEKKIVASQKDIYVAHANSDYEACENALNALSKPLDLGSHINNNEPIPSAKADLNNPPADKSEWTYAMWAKHDSKGLKDMRDNDPNKFTSLKEKA